MKRRYYELDLYRVVACLLLPFVHIVEFLGGMYDYANILTSDSLVVLNTITEAFCMVGAPAFILCMGFNISNTSHNTPSDFLKRGIFLILVEFILNLLRYEIPGAICLLLAKTPESTEKLYFAMGLGIFNSDILALAGLAFIAFALFRKLKLKNWAILAIAIGLYVVDFVLNETIMATVDANLHDVLSNFLGNFIYINTNSTFPFTEWLLFIVVGYLYAEYLNHCEDKNENKFFLILTIVNAIAVIGCYVYCEIAKDPVGQTLVQSVAIRSMAPVTLIAGISGCSLTICWFHWIFKLFKLDNRTKFCEWVKHFSTNTTAFYINQWVIIGWLMIFAMGLILDSQIIPLWGTLILYVAVATASYFLADPTNYLLGKLRKLTHLD